MFALLLAHVPDRHEILVRYFGAYSVCRRAGFEQENARGAQGVANIASSLFGGIPATGAIARTATNIKNGGLTPIAGIVHAVVLMLIMLYFGKWAALIPMATLAGILVVVAYNMSEWRSFRKILRAPRSDIAVMLVTVGMRVVPTALEFIAIKRAINKIATSGETGTAEIQKAFDRNHAVQCGFCTPGMILSVKALLKAVPKPTVEEINEAIKSGEASYTIKATGVAVRKTGHHQGIRDGALYAGCTDPGRRCSSLPRSSLTARPSRLPWNSSVT